MIWKNEKNTKIQKIQFLVIKLATKNRFAKNQVLTPSSFFLYNLHNGVSKPPNPQHYNISSIWVAVWKTGSDWYFDHFLPLNHEVFFNFVFTPQWTVVSWKGDKYLHVGLGIIRFRPLKVKLQAFEIKKLIFWSSPKIRKTRCGVAQPKIGAPIPKSPWTLESLVWDD